MTADGGAFCVRFGVFFVKAILSFFDFWTIFCCCFFNCLFIFALTFHKCQIVMKVILSFFDIGTIFVVFYFSFHFCFDLPQVSNCYESDSFIFGFLDHFLLFFILSIFALTFHKCQIVMKAILSFFDFWTIFLLFLIFLFIFALTFHKCQIVMKAILSFLFFALFFSVCWAPRCSFFRRAFFVRFCLCFLFLSGFFGFLFGSWSWAPRCSFFPSGFLCAFRCFFFFFKKAILSFFDFWTIFC